MAPARAAAKFKEMFPDAEAYRATLYGSLGATGRGHLTDSAVGAVFAPKPVSFIWRPNEELPRHPNGMRLAAVDLDGAVLKEVEDYSLGGGALASDSHPEHCYSLTTMNGILQHCEESGESLWEYAWNCEGPEFRSFLTETWRAMDESIARGLQAQGLLPGGLGLPRKACSLYHRAKELAVGGYRELAYIAAYAYAVSEENAAGEIIVTAPTCGSCGVLPSVLKFFSQEPGCTSDDIVRALIVAGLIGNIVKLNGSISGAEVGCQGEIGAACAMAAGAAAQLLGGSPRQIEYAAEMGLEHHLGLTCDPVAGLVQIPCIERNAHAATRALSSARFALLSDGLHRISFDDVVAVMTETGRNLSKLYRETSCGGLALLYQTRFNA